MEEKLGENQKTRGIWGGGENGQLTYRARGSSRRVRKREKATNVLGPAWSGGGEKERKVNWPAKGRGGEGQPKEKNEPDDYGQNYTMIMPRWKSIRVRGRKSRGKMDQIADEKKKEKVLGVECG